MCSKSVGLVSNYSAMYKEVLTDCSRCILPHKVRQNAGSIRLEESCTSLVENRKTAMLYSEAFQNFLLDTARVTRVIRLGGFMLSRR